MYHPPPPPEQHDNNSVFSATAIAAANASPPPPADLSDDDSSLLGRITSVVGRQSSSSSQGPELLSSPPPPPLVVLLRSDCKDNYDSVPLNKRLRTLFAMCFGQFESDDVGARRLCDFTVEPYLSSRQKKTFKPTQQDMVAEARRRFKISNPTAHATKLRISNYNVDGLTLWLCNNKTSCPVDVAFLREQESKFYNRLLRGQVERMMLQTPTAAGGVIFTHTADLRMVHCLLEDEVRQAFISRHDCLDRAALDARNSPHRPKTWLEQIAAKFNSEEFVPESEVFPNLHNDFAEPIDLSLQKCPGKVTTDQVKVWIADRKAKLVLLIDRWERSGNGDGQRLEADHQYGSVGDIHYQSDDRANFLKTERPTLLYYWNMLVKYEILQDAVSILPNELAVSSSAGNLEPSAENSSSVSASVNNKNRLRQKRKNGGSVDDEREQRTAAFQEMMLKIVCDERQCREANRKVQQRIAAEQQRIAAERSCSIAEESWLRLVSLVAGATDPAIKTMYEGRLAVALQRLKSADARLLDKERLPDGDEEKEE
jgi:hypothetical protein